MEKKIKRVKISRNLLKESEMIFTDELIKSYILSLNQKIIIQFLNKVIIKCDNSSKKSLLLFLFYVLIDKFLMIVMNVIFTTHLSIK